MIYTLKYTSSFFIHAVAVELIFCFCQTNYKLVTIITYFNIKKHQYHSNNISVSILYLFHGFEAHFPKRVFLDQLLNNEHSTK